VQVCAPGCVLSQFVGTRLLHCRQKRSFLSTTHDSIGQTIHSFLSLYFDRSIVSYKANSPQSAIWCSFFNLQHPTLPVSQSSSSCLRILPLFPVIYNLPAIFLSIMCLALMLFHQLLPGRHNLQVLIYCLIFNAFLFRILGSYVIVLLLFWGDSRFFRSIVVINVLSIGCTSFIPLGDTMLRLCALRDVVRCPESESSFLYRVDIE
jgi:hypothetical protein